MVFKEWRPVILWNLQDCDTIREFFKVGPGLWANLISVFEFEGSPLNKSMRRSTLDAVKPTAFQWFLETLDDPQMCCQLGQTGHLVTADESFWWFQSVCTSATWRLWTICQSAPKGRLLWGLNFTVLSGCLFTWCRQCSVIIQAWLPARHAIPNQR